MSYILDALKRADADRERGHVPGLHSQPVSLASPSRASQPLHARLGAGRGLALVTWLALALLGAAAAVWWWSRPAPTDPGVVLAAPRIDTAPAPSRVEPTPSEPASPSSAAAGEPPAMRPDAPVLPILAPPVAPPAAAPAAAAARAQAPASAGTRTAVSAAPVVESSAPRPDTAPAAVPRFADLPPQTRAQLPAVSINGSTYSQNPAHRMLIANGKVVQEGGEIAPGLTLETIGPRSAVLNHQGVRYSIGY